MSAQTTSSGVATEESPKLKKKRGKGKPTPFQASLIVSTVEVNANGKSFVNSSQPFRLNNKLGCTSKKSHS